MKQTNKLKLSFKDKQEKEEFLSKAEPLMKVHSVKDITNTYEDLVDSDLTLLTSGVRYNENLMNSVALEAMSLLQLDPEEYSLGLNLIVEDPFQQVLDWDLSVNEDTESNYGLDFDKTDALKKMIRTLLNNGSDLFDDLFYKLFSNQYDTNDPVFYGNTETDDYIRTTTKLPGFKKETDSFYSDVSKVIADSISDLKFAIGYFSSLFYDSSLSKVEDSLVSHTIRVNEYDSVQSDGSVKLLDTMIISFTKDYSSVSFYYSSDNPRWRNVAKRVVDVLNDESKKIITKHIYN